MHIHGIDNKVTDSLSHYYKNDMGDESHLEHIYVNADAKLDPDGRLWPTDRYMELRTAAMRQSNCLVKKRESWIIESEEMNDSTLRALPKDVLPSIDDNDIVVTAASSDSTTLRARVEESMDLTVKIGF
jgi:hypothetical protein